MPRAHRRGIFPRPAFGSWTAAYAAVLVLFATGCRTRRLAPTPEAAPGPGPAPMVGSVGSSPPDAPRDLCSGELGPPPVGVSEDRTASDLPADVPAVAHDAPRTVALQGASVAEERPAAAEERPTTEASDEETRDEKRPDGDPADWKDAPCPPLVVSGDIDEPLREPWKPHEPAYYPACEPECRAPEHEQDDHSRISDKYVRPDPCSVPRRPQTLLEFGDPFMSPGRISRGLCLPTGQVIQPRLLMYGTYRSALQGAYGGGASSRTEWANRLDLFFNLQISATERVLLGFRPLSDGTDFTGYEFEPSDDTVNGFNGKVRTLFFEGEIGEIFPRLSPSDFRPWDVGFVVGRQPIFTQGGIMINDDLDSFGLTRNSVRPRGTSNVLVSGLVAWNELHRGLPAREDEDALLVALHSEIDLPKTFLELDVAGIDSDRAPFGDALFLGVGASQRIDKASTIFRVNQSIALDGNTAATGTGTLFTGEVSFVPAATHDNLYVNAFAAFGQYDSAARRPESGGPLGAMGIQFASPGIGRVGAALSPRAEDVIGGAVGYQRFYCGGRRNLLAEFAARASTGGPDTSAVSGALRYQWAVGQHTVLTAMAWLGWASAPDEVFGGARFECLFKF